MAVWLDGECWEWIDLTADGHLNGYGGSFRTTGAEDAYSDGWRYLCRAIPPTERHVE